MSRAFVKESDGSELEELPELVVSPHRNLVTPEGFAAIDGRVRELELELTAARGSNDRATAARVERDLRYWRQRKRTAEVIVPETTPASVRFGCRVVLETPSGQVLRYRIVGEDESDPRQGLVSYVSPLAEALLGCAPGDVVRLPAGDAEIVAIE